MPTPQLELSLQNRYNALTLNQMFYNTNYVEHREAYYTTSIKANQNPRNRPQTLLGWGPEETLISPHLISQTLFWLLTITMHEIIARTENLTIAETYVSELTKLLPHPSNYRISINPGSFDFLQRKIGFSLLREKLRDWQSQHVFILGSITTLGKGIKPF